jgi:LytS/YehU family sensor histidine kinase
MLDDKAQALHYLSQLSKFIRLILQYSKNHFNSIEYEKNLIDHYLELEQVRFGFKFTYILSCNATVRMMPSMIVFPFVEEALYERVLPSEGSIEKRNLRITFESRIFTTVITIMDNGNANRSNVHNEAINIALNSIEELNQYHDEQITLERKYEIENNIICITIPHSIF